MTAFIGRREFMTLLSGAVSWPVVAGGQQLERPLIGFLGAPAREAYVHYAAALRRGLREAGYVEGQNLTIEERWAENQYDRLPALAAELVGRRVEVIVTIGGAPAAVAAKAATSTIPIVFHMGADPVQLGIVASLNRPGGNITGATLLGVALDAKRLELLHEAAPIASSIGLLVNPTNPQTEELSRQVLEAAHTMGLSIVVIGASSAAEIEPCFAELVKKQAGGLVISADSFLGQRAQQIAGLALRYKIPTITQGRQFAKAGGLMSYSTDIVDVYRQVGIYVGRVLKGEKPADLPITQPTKFELAINLRTAKALAIEVPPPLLARADEVIE
jgi:putative ABC transport system substrate-binding protein